MQNQLVGELYPVLVLVRRRCDCSVAVLAGADRQVRWFFSVAVVGRCAMTDTDDNDNASGGMNGDVSRQELFKKACEAARLFAANPKGWLVLIGPAGSGKTHLAAATVNERISHGLPAFFVTTPDLLDHLRSAFNPNSELPYDELFERVKNSPLLVIYDKACYFYSVIDWQTKRLKIRC